MDTAPLPDRRQMSGSSAHFLTLLVRASEATIFPCVFSPPPPTCICCRRITLTTQMRKAALVRHRRSSVGQFVPQARGRAHLPSEPACTVAEVLRMGIPLRYARVRRGGRLNRVDNAGVRRHLFRV